MLRLAKIPNSRCLGKNQNKQGKKPKTPQTQRAKFSGTDAAQGCPAAYRMAPPGREGMGHDRVDAPTQEGGTDLESEAVREGRKPS